MKSIFFGKKNKILVLILALVIMAEFFLPQKKVLCAAIINTSEIRAVIEKTFENIQITDEIVENAGTSDCDWLVFAIGRYICTYGVGGSFGNLGAYREALCEYVRGKYAQNGGLHRNKATEWHRISLALLACGGNPENISCGGGDVSPINLIADGTYGCVAGAPWRQGVNGAIYALITLDSMNYTIPDGAVYTRDDIISYIISQELDGGGFSMAGSSAAVYDTDVTAMAVQALAKYCGSREDVRMAVDRSLACLQEGLGKDASYGNASSTAQVLLALTCAGIDVTEDRRFITENGQNIIDGIMNFYDGDESMFCFTKNSEPGFMATTQCLYALTGWCRQADGFGLLYDFGSAAGPPVTPTDAVTAQSPYMTPEPDTAQSPYTTPEQDTAQSPYTTPEPDTAHNPYTAPEPDTAKSPGYYVPNDVKNKGKTVKKTNYKVKSKYNKPIKQLIRNSREDTAANDNSKQEKQEKSGDKERAPGDIIIKRDEAYVTEQELADIIGTDRNILIDGSFDGTHRCLVTINGADVNTCRRMNLKVSAGSGNDLYDKDIMGMASGAYIFKLDDDNGIMCAALYSVEAPLADGDYLLMKYFDGEAHYVDKAEAADGYLRFVTDSPGVYFVCREVRLKDKVKGELKDELKDSFKINDNAEKGFEKYMAGAVMAAAAALCMVIILKGRRKKYGSQG